MDFRFWCFFEKWHVFSCFWAIYWCFECFYEIQWHFPYIWTYLYCRRSRMKSHVTKAYNRKSNNKLHRELHSFRAQPVRTETPQRIIYLIRRTAFVSSPACTYRDSATNYIFTLYCTQNIRRTHSFRAQPVRTETPQRIIYLRTAFVSSPACTYRDSATNT